MKNSSRDLGDEIGHVEAEVNHLIWELRQKVEINPNEPVFMQAVRGLGYRLETHAGRRRSFEF